MPAFNIETAIKIDASLAQVRESLIDYNTWPIWSPWLYMERDCALSYQGNAGEPGHGYEWHGKKIGAGRMTLLSVSEQRIESDLNFIKPFKSYAQIIFKLKPVSDNQTEVAWLMNSSMPFFLFFMIGKMKGMIKNDYDRGLRMLKDYIETGVVTTSTVIDSIVELPAQHYIGVQQSSSLANMGESMVEAFPEALRLASAADTSITGMPFAIYNKFDIQSGRCDYIAAMPVATAASVANGVSAERPACRALRLVHTGPYRHLGNAWSMGMNELRHVKLKPSKKVAPFEQYINDPENTPEESLKTELYLPVR